MKLARQTKRAVRKSCVAAVNASEAFSVLILKVVPATFYFYSVQNLYIERSDVTGTCGHITISMLWGNTAYCVKSSGEDLWRYLNKIESVGLQKCPYYHYLVWKAMSQ